MTNRKQERIAKNALGIFLDVWCSVDERDEDSTANNCHHCEFANPNGVHCIAKTFVATTHFEDRFPQGCMTKEVE